MCYLHIIVSELLVHTVLYLIKLMNCRFYRVLRIVLLLFPNKMFDNQDIIQFSYKKKILCDDLQHGRRHNLKVIIKTIIKSPFIQHFVS